ncbi:DUF1868 domain-containing protein [Paenibacillus sp. SGZ-1009]|uniref:DUF1868 domain-containing protein n=1 Tax=Paenibacillus campi TaxID=3106031 RepID=UPI002AFEF22E|nr:DUF1868 domain-containing protein [Paenibacillus sp. SGZ-1009]
MQDEASYKFDQHGQAQYYPGNTVISFIHDDRFAVYRLAKQVSQRFRESSIAHVYAFLPYNSFHMTVLKLCREIDRGTALWSPLLPNDASFTEIDRILQSIVAGIAKPEPIQMRVQACHSASIRLEPATTADAQRIADYRERLAQATRIRHADHDHYPFHLTFSYQLAAVLDAEQEAVVENICSEYNKLIQREPISFALPEPVFAIFNTMLHYDTDLQTRIIK